MSDRKRKKYYILTLCTLTYLTRLCVYPRCQPRSIGFDHSYLFCIQSSFFSKKTKIINNYTLIKNCSKKCGRRCKKHITSKKAFLIPPPLPTSHTLLFFLQRHSLHVIPLKVTNYGIKNNNFFYSNTTYEGSYNIIHKMIN